MGYNNHYPHNYWTDSYTYDNGGLHFKLFYRRRTLVRSLAAISCQIAKKQRDYFDHGYYGDAKPFAVGIGRCYPCV